MLNIKVNNVLKIYYYQKQPYNSGYAQWKTFHHSFFLPSIYILLSSTFVYLAPVTVLYDCINNKIKSITQLSNDYTQEAKPWTGCASL
jgi:hypothetical protein